MISNVYEIHKYEQDRFQCVVKRTNKYDEHKVIKDTEEMNSMLSQEAKSQGIRYILAIASMSYTTRQRTRKIRKQQENNHSSLVTWLVD